MPAGGGATGGGGSSSSKSKGSFTYFSTVTVLQKHKNAQLERRDEALEIMTKIAKQVSKTLKKPHQTPGFETLDPRHALKPVSGSNSRPHPTPGFETLDPRHALRWGAGDFRRKSLLAPDPE